MNIWHDISEERIKPEEFVACIEISKNSKMKYELDKETGRLILDRVLYTSTHYPANYGFIPKTYEDDNDPLDVLVICQGEIVPLCLVKCYPIGIIKMIDGTKIDQKVSAIASGDPSYSCYKDISELPEHMFNEMRHFFKVYKELEGQSTYIMDTLGAEEAKKMIAESILSYKEKFN